MPINRIDCPDCGAGLKSSTGFDAGKKIRCPRCETTFQIPMPFEEVEDEAEMTPSARKPIRAKSNDNDVDLQTRPKKKKKRQAEKEEEENSYRKSWLRFLILGILIVAMLVLLYFLIDKRKKEAQDDVKPVVPAAGGPDSGPPAPPPLPGMFRPNPNSSNQQGAGLFRMGQGAQNPQLLTILAGRLLGVWEGLSPDGSKHTIEYQPQGTFKHTVSSSKGETTTGGQYTISGLIGSTVLILDRPIGDRKTVQVAIEDDELVHDSVVAGESILLRRKR